LTVLARPHRVASLAAAFATLLALSTAAPVSAAPRRAKARPAIAERAKPAARPAVATRAVAVKPRPAVKHAAAARSPRDPYARALGKALDDPALAGAQVGALVVEVGSGKVRFGRNADTRFIPASTMKLLTAAAALIRLGPEYAWLTPVLAGGPVVDGTVQGDLYVRGSGDPSFVAEQIYRLAAGIRAAGVRRVEGALVADASTFLPEGPPPGWQLYDGPEAYHPPIGALSFNFNAVEVNVRPAGEGLPPLVTLDPPTAYIRVVNQAQTGPPGAPETLTVGRAAAVPVDPVLASVDAGAGPSPVGPRLPTATLEVSGVLPADAGARRAFRLVEGPAVYFATALRETLAALGVEVVGGAVEGTTPTTAQPIMVYRSRPLAPILADMGKFSNNFMAEMVLRTLGVEATGGPASSVAGIEVIRGVLRELGTDPSTVQIADGSGLSRLNLLAPTHLVAVLRAMERRFDAGAEFQAGFGLLGVDGTVQRRYADSPASRRVRAKTGSLNGVRTLAGYAEGPRGEPLAFALFLNNLAQPIDRVVAAERRFVEALTGRTP
jgi:D-alanyl-D-alanine carboxypeptidase/D-alanyl-D-alanine-endopeptidase (penicillin-binding protein 4)